MYCDLAAGEGFLRLSAFLIGFDFTYTDCVNAGFGFLLKLRFDISYMFLASCTGLLFKTFLRPFGAATIVLLKNE